MSTVQELQAQLLIVKAKAYDDREKAETTQKAYQEAIGNIAKSLGYSADEPVTVAQMQAVIEHLFTQLSQAKAKSNEDELELNRLRNEMSAMLSVPAVIVHEDEDSEAG